MPCKVILGAVLLVSIPAGPMARAQELKIPNKPNVLHLAPEPSERFPAKWYPRLGDGTDVAETPVLEKPYTAVVKTMYMSQAVSGERSPYITRGFQARDRFGRLRKETRSGTMTIGDKDAFLKTVIVADPVSHCSFHWMELENGSTLRSTDRIAFATCAPRIIRFRDLKLFESLFDDGTVSRGDPSTQAEHLSPLQIDGISVDRLRVTNTNSDENGKVKKWVSETWYSRDLEELIRLGDEENGYEMLTEIKRADPDPKLFYPPEGWNIDLQAPR